MLISQNMKFYLIDQRYFGDLFVFLSFFSMFLITHTDMGNNVQWSWSHNAKIPFTFTENECKNAFIDENKRIPAALMYNGYA